MSSSFLVYPPAPKGISDKILEPSATFKSEVVRMAGSLVFFIGIYFALIISATILAIACAWGGYLLVTNIPKFITLMLGLGLAGTGLLVLFFLFKFLFTRQKTDRSGMIEVTEASQPQLFAFIRQLAAETQTPFPKRIYLSSDVNACVFYDSSFWSMFFPVRKNLQIGLGLVNSVTISEFKAILAHEFGHFSQRSMKLGSYVYHVNHIIYNLLYENDGFSRLLERWGNMSGYFALFSGITVKIIRGIQWVLQKSYDYVNKNYMSLSRQMEYHADAVAAFVSGSEPLITSLRRLEAADLCFHRVLNLYNSWISQNVKSENMYQDHTWAMYRFGQEFEVPLVHGQLQVDANTKAFMSYSKLVITDQWASHPSTEDREKHLLSLGITCDTFQQSAWSVFTNPELLQKQMTDLVYGTATFTNTPEVYSPEMFKEKFDQYLEENSFNRAYKGFYDNRNITEFDIENELQAEGLPIYNTYETLFSEENCALPVKVSTLESDLKTISSIINKELPVKTFDYAGERYLATNAAAVKQQLEIDLTLAQSQLAFLDKAVFRFFYKLAEVQGKSQEIINGYKHLFTIMNLSDKDEARFTKIVDIVRPAFIGQLSLSQGFALADSIKEQERELHRRMKQMLADEAYLLLITKEQKEHLTNYLEKDLTYCSEQGFENEAIDLLMNALDVYVHLASEIRFQTKKQLLDKQLCLLPGMVTCKKNVLE